MRITDNDPFVVDLDEWPRDVDLIISALHAAGSAVGERRGAARHRHRVIAQLTLFCNLAEHPTRLFVRDCSERHLGFLASTSVPLGYGGTVELLGPQGNRLSIACVVYRCRECVPGWYEGALHFNRVQPDLKFPD